MFDEFRETVLRHAGQEKIEEFPGLRTRSDKERRVLAAAIKAAEPAAPTHPHPGVESATANLMAGPFAAAADRTRDIIRKMMEHDSH